MVSTSATTFPQFSSLPVELQLIIWHLAGKAVNVNPQLCGLFFTILSDIRPLHHESAYACLIRCAPYEIFQVKYFAATSPLLATCILARWCALKEWKKQIMMPPKLKEEFSRSSDSLRRALVKDLEDRIEEVEDGLRRRQNGSVTVSRKSVDEGNSFNVLELKDEIEALGDGLTRRKNAVGLNGAVERREQESFQVLELAYRHTRRYKTLKS